MVDEEEPDLKHVFSPVGLASFFFFFLLMESVFACVLSQNRIDILVCLSLKKESRTDYYSARTESPAPRSQQMFLAGNVLRESADDDDDDVRPVCCLQLIFVEKGSTKS